MEQLTSFLFRTFVTSEVKAFGWGAIQNTIQNCAMQVWPLNTVQFSNHTQYKEGWEGMIIPGLFCFVI